MMAGKRRRAHAKWARKKRYQVSGDLVSIQIYKDRFSCGYYLLNIQYVLLCKKYSNFSYYNVVCTVIKDGVSGGLITKRWTAWTTKGRLSIIASDVWRLASDSRFMTLDVNIEILKKYISGSVIVNESSH